MRLQALPCRFSHLFKDVCASQGGSGAGKKQVAAMLGVQTLRASTRPRPFLRLSPQHLAVQVHERECSSCHKCCAFVMLCFLDCISSNRNSRLTDLRVVYLCHVLECKFRT